MKSNDTVLIVNNFFELFDIIPTGSQYSIISMILRYVVVL